MKSWQIICFGHLPSFDGFHTRKNGQTNCKAHTFLTAWAFSIEWRMSIKYKCLLYSRFACIVHLR